MAPQKKADEEEDHDEELEMDLDDDDELDVSLRPRGSSMSAPLSSSSSPHDRPNNGPNIMHALEMDDITALPTRVSMPSMASSAAARAQCLDRRSSWLDTAFLLVADIVGTGILGLAAQVARLGWGAGVFFLLVIYPLNIYSGLLLQRLHIAYPATQSYPDIGYAVLGPRWGKIVAVALYAYFFFVLGNYAQVLTQSLQGIFPTSQLCMPHFGLIVTLCLLPFIQLRSMHSLSGLAVVSAVTIFTPLALCVAAIVKHAPTPRPVVPSGVPAGTSFLDAMESFTGILFAYSGQSIYPNLLSEMRKPEEFAYSLSAAAPVLVGSYFVAAAVGVYYLGSGAPHFLMDVLEDEWMRQIGGWCLFLHMLISYTITSAVVSRAIHLWLDPVNANVTTGITPNVQWFFIALAVAMNSYIVSNVIPFFKDLTEIIGALNLGPISFGFPATLYIVHRLRARRKSSGISLKAMSRLDWSVCILLLFLCAYTVPIGLWADVTALIRDWHTFGGPFDCHRYSAEHRSGISKND